MRDPLFVSERTKPKITAQPLSVGCLIFERMDQIDFTGPFEVLSRMPNSTIQIVGKEVIHGEYVARGDQVTAYLLQHR